MQATAIACIVMELFLGIYNRRFGLLNPLALTPPAREASWSGTNQDAQKGTWKGFQKEYFAGRDFESWDFVNMNTQG